jgi:hypothetical protein
MCTFSCGMEAIRAQGKSYSESRFITGIELYSVALMPMPPNEKGWPTGKVAPAFLLPKLQSKRPESPCQFAEGHENRRRINVQVLKSSMFRLKFLPAVI